MTLPKEWDDLLFIDTNNPPATASNYRFVCRSCRNSWSGNFYRSAGHYLQECSGRGVGLCPHTERNAALIVNLRSYVRTKTPKRLRRSSSDAPVKQAAPSDNVSIVEAFQSNKRTLADETLTKFFCCSNVAFNTVDSSLFAEFVSLVGQIGTSYSVPASSTMRNTLMPNVYSEEKENVDYDIKNNLNGWTLTTDGWSDGDRSLINFILVSPNVTTFFRALDVSDKPKTGEYIALLIQDVIADIGKEKIIQVVTDSGSNFVSAMSTVQEVYPKIFHTRCLCHSLDLVLESMHKYFNQSSYPEVSTFFEQVRTIVTFFTAHSKPRALLKNHTHLKIRKYPETRFYYRFLTLKRIVRIRDALDSLMGDLSYITWWRAI
ncbi:hypothetical protein GEMRC1_013731 [Eukaryota sp. GEM-RC1]